VLVFRGRVLEGILHDESYRRQTYFELGGKFPRLTTGPRWRIEDNV